MEEPLESRQIEHQKVVECTEDNAALLENTDLGVSNFSEVKLSV